MSTPRRFLFCEQIYGLADSNPSKTARPLGHLTPLPISRKHCFYGILSATLLPLEKGTPSKPFEEREAKT